MKTLVPSMKKAFEREIGVAWMGLVKMFADG